MNYSFSVFKHTKTFSGFLTGLDAMDSSASPQTVQSALRGSLGPRSANQDFHQSQISTRQDCVPFPSRYVETFCL